MINWKVRLRNKTWLMTAVPVVCGAVYAVLGVFGIVPEIAESTIENVILAVIGALAVLGVLEDPTTAGVGDSERALTYIEPADDRNEGEQNE